MVTPRDSSSSSEDQAPPTLSSSRLRADFRELSPDSEEEICERQAISRGRQSRGEETRRSQQRSRRNSGRVSLIVDRDNSLHVIKTLKGWGLRYSGDEKELPEQCLSRLKACKRATGIPDEQLLPCLASILVKDAGDSYEVYQDDMLSWDFKTFEQGFKRQFVVELHVDDVMEELRARYQGSKQKIAPFITKFRRIIVHLKRPLLLRQQLNLTFTHLRPEYQDALWEKNLDSFDAIERYGRELERREAIKERYRSPPRRDKSGIAGTNYTGPHRGTHKAAATVEVLAAEENGPPEPEKNPRKGNRGRTKEPYEQVAAARNTAYPGLSEVWGAKNGPDRGNRQTMTSTRNNPGVGGERVALYSQPAPYSLLPVGTTTSAPLQAFVGPCFIFQLVGHRAMVCPKRICYNCKQLGRFSRDCPNRQATRGVVCQGCGREGSVLKDCPNANCRRIVAALENGLGNSPART